MWKWKHDETKGLAKGYPASEQRDAAWTTFCAVPKPVTFLLDATALTHANVFETQRKRKASGSSAEAEQGWSLERLMGSWDISVPKDGV